MLTIPTIRGQHFLTRMGMIIQTGWWKKEIRGWKLVVRKRKSNIYLLISNLQSPFQEQIQALEIQSLAKIETHIMEL